MTLLAPAIVESIEKGSWIRRMFEAGIALKREHGENAVCDFSLGNPDLPPPPAVADGLRALADKAVEPFALGYMPNGGYAWARDLLAAHLSKEQGVSLTGADVLLTCGAAGGLNSLFKAVLSPGEEVLVSAPFFVEYGAYAANHGGVLRPVPSQKDFSLDVEAIAAALTPKTRVLILNSPNNPTGRVYSRAELRTVCEVLAAHSKKHDRPVFIAVDEPYRFLAFDGVEVPSLLGIYPYAVLVSSFSKNLSMPGERVGYMALSPLMEGRTGLMDGLILANRILGYVNPPVVGQHLMKAALGSQVDAGIYLRRRNTMAEILKDAGYEFHMPQGAFYFFPKAPGGDDVAFCSKLMKELILGVPGSGFGRAGHFRLAFCVGEEVIRRAAQGFKRALQG